MVTMNDQSSIKYKYRPTQHLLAFVDTLGFYKEIQKKKSDTIEEYLSVFDLLKNSWSNRAAKRELKLSAIGDSVILAVDVHGSMSNGIVLQENHSEFNESLYNLCWAVAELQYGLAIKNIWTRGAITLGLLDFDPVRARLLGPAFHTAYKLESTVAKFPRVIVDGVVIRATGIDTTSDFINTIHSVYQQVNPVPLLYNYYSTQGPSEFIQDVPTFIDFVGWGSYQLGASPLKVFTEYLLKRMKDDVEHFAKYRWLANYVINVMVDGPKREGPDGVNLCAFLERLQRG